MTPIKVRSYQPHEYFLHLQEQPGNSPSDVPAPGIGPEKTATVQVDRLYYRAVFFYNISIPINMLIEDTQYSQ